jgi:small-conductance mechanosensitive channel
MSETARTLASVIAIMVVIGLSAYVSFELVRALARRLTRNNPAVMEAVERCRKPAWLLVAGILAEIVLRAFGDRDDGWFDTVDHAVSILITIAVTWLLCAIAIVVEGVVLREKRAEVGSDDAAGRRAQTQIILLRRLIVAAIITFGLAVILMSFPGVRTLGQGLLASAGLISIVAGLAAQTSLSNVFAGIQLALTDSIRVGDVVVVEGQSGYISEITLTYVVVRLWDERNLILPSLYFITQPFENWTRNRAEIGGSVELDVGWTAPVEKLREEFDRILTESPEWDGRIKRFVVADATNGIMRIRIDVSAYDTGQLFRLRNNLRENMVAYIAGHYPEAVLHRRTPWVSDGLAPAPGEELP